MTGDPGSYQKAFSERLRMIDTEIFPLARARLREIATKSRGIDLAEVDTLEGPLLRLGWWMGVKTCIQNAHDATVLLTVFGTLKDLAGLTHIVKLNLACLPLRTEHLRQVCYLPNLRHLDISYSGLSGDDVGCLVGLSLETLKHPPA